MLSQAPTVIRAIEDRVVIMSKKEALNSLNNFFNERIKLDIEVGDVNFNKGLVSMVNSYFGNNMSMNTSALHIAKHSTKAQQVGT